MPEILEASAPLYAFMATLALPWGVRGPVELSHGLQRFMLSDCFARLSGVHPLLIGSPVVQYFVRGLFFPAPGMIYPVVHLLRAI